MAKAQTDQIGSDIEYKWDLICSIRLISESDLMLQSYLW